MALYDSILLVHVRLLTGCAWVDTSAVRVLGRRRMFANLASFRTLRMVVDIKVMVRLVLGQDTMGLRIQPAV